jgi:hypothetical protein
MNAVQFSGTFKIHNPEDRPRGHTIIRNTTHGLTKVPHMVSRHRPDGQNEVTDYFTICCTINGSQDSQIIKKLHKARIDFDYTSDGCPQKQVATHFFSKFLSCFKPKQA